MTGRISRGVIPAVMACLCFTPHASLFAQDINLEKQLIVESLRNREAVEKVCLHAVVEVEVTGPASLLIVPDNRQGEEYRQLNVQDWWADDQKIAVATRRRSEHWLDGKKIAEVADGELPLFVYTFDGERHYLLDFRSEGKLLEINTRWPYEHSAHPVLFGRATSSLALTECLADGFELVRTEKVQEQPCSVVSFSVGHGQVVAWLTRNEPVLAVREEYHNANGIVLTRDFEFASTPVGFKYPKRGTEVRTEQRGTVTTVWTITEFEIDPVLPSYVFTPTPNEAGVVVDRATRQALRGAGK